MMPTSSLVLLVVLNCTGIAVGAGALSAPTIAQAAETNGARVFSGTVTWLDADRHLVVLQEGSEARALRLDLARLDLKVGEWVRVEGRATPMITAFPDYPDRPAGREITRLFETPTDRSGFYLTRMRGYLHPPVTGKYTFWIASDDSSELWFSDNSNADAARRIATVGSGRWTESRQWTRFPSQQSQEIQLKAGESYYIEALSQDGGGRNCLAVAWQGPGMERAVIDGRYLSPWTRDGGEVQDPADTNGVLREYWMNFTSGDLSVLRSPDEFVLNLHPARIVDRHPGKMPEAIRTQAGSSVRPQENFCWVEAEGHLNFSAKADGRRDLDLVEGTEHFTVCLRGDDARLAALPANSLLRVRGMCEAARGPDNELQMRAVWVSDPANIVWLDTEENWSQFKPTPMHFLSSSNPDLVPGRLVRTRGRVVRQEQTGVWRIQGDDGFSGYTSADGTNWVAIGAPVEIAMSNSVLAGFAVASHQNANLAEVHFDHVRGLSGKLQSVDIGEPPLPGGCEFDGVNYTVRGSGADMWLGSDQCHFAFQRLDGAGEIVARVADLKSADPLAKAGLMIRETTSSQSSWAAMMVMPSRRMGLQTRQVTGKNAAGVLSIRQEDWIKLVRRQNSLLVRPASHDALEPGLELDILGTFNWERGNPVLAEARCREITDHQMAVAISTGAQVSGDEVRDTRIADLKSEAARAERAGINARLRIRGVVTFSGVVGGDSLIFVQDDTTSCLVRLRASTPKESFHIGSRVELTGTPSPNESMLEFQGNGIANLGEGNMPQALRFPFEPAVSGRQNGRWIEIEGVGRSARANGTLLVMTRSGVLPVWAGNALDGLLERCVNASVRIRGVYWQASSPTVLLPSKKFIEIREPAPRDPFDVPVFPIDTLRALNSNPETLRRMKVAGVVTCRRDDFFLAQDSSGGIRVATALPSGVKAGDAVEIVGFPSEQALGTVLHEALVRRTGNGVMPAPVPLSMDEVMDERNSGRVVASEAVLLEQRFLRGMQSLDLQAGQRVFRALLPASAGRLPAIAAGSRIRVSGVSQIERAERSPDEAVHGHEPLAVSMALHLRTPADVIVLQRPPWWNWKHTAALAGFAAVGLGGALIWITMLRQRVDQRTHELRDTMARLQKETQISATLAERDRLAGEIHDSLEQGLSAILMQMDAATKVIHQPDKVAHYLDMTRNMAAFSRAEVQHAVWDLQSPLLENADLATALRRVAGEISAGDTPRVTVDISGPMRPLPSTMEHHLLRIGQEAITNAVKHAQPKTIRVALDYDADRVSLAIHDDGCGFNPQAVTVGSSSHFGLQGLRTRARKLDASLTISSKPGEGTNIKVVVPLEASGSPANSSLDSSQPDSKL